MLKKILTYCLCIIAAEHLLAQDIHFSNFYTNSLNVNPAETGFFTGQYRYCLAYRDQYRTVADPYQTFSANLDGKFTKRYWNYVIGYGILLNFDMAGDADYNTVQFGIPIAQHMNLMGNTIILSYGILPALHYNAFDYTNLSFQEQFNGIQYNPDQEISEDFVTNSKTYFDFSGGLQLSYKQSKTQTYTIGFAAYNINQPNVSFYNEETVRLRTRFLLHGNAIIDVTSNIDVIPGFKMQFQGKQHEFHFGGMGLFNIENSSVSQIQTGLWFRSKNKDAVIFGIGCRYMDFDIMLNYDLNISSLRNASNGHGAFEITVSYITEQHNKSKRRTAIRCPHSL
ncbi:MAG: PorP/SprF family type IX secretion system membrane protein [Bacteroidales bacterium]|nr:PorP/SprF family type IX secretion system membrane protein [Bacteroidales bacterium]